MTPSNRDRDLASRARSRRNERDYELKTRVWRRPRTGTKVTTLVGLAFLACAVYFLFAPVYMDTANGWFGCGNFIQGSDQDFVNEVCKGAPGRNGALAALFGALAVIIGGFGAVLFGFDVKVEHKRFPLGNRDKRRNHPTREDLFVGDPDTIWTRGGNDVPTRHRRGTRKMWEE